MPGGLLGDAGAKPQKEPTYAPIFVAASLTGLYTQRSVFHDPSNVVTQRYYGGRPDTLWDGLNIELSNELTLIRRFGCSQFSGTTYPQAPTCAFSFEHTDGTIQVIVDTPAFVYIDNQDGTKTTLFTKSAGAGQGYFVAAGNVLYYGDGVDTLKYTSGNPNGLTWNWGGNAPSAPPNVVIVESGSAAATWVASTVFSTMGLIVDSNSNVQQLISVNILGTNTTQLGTTGAGQPVWNNTTGGTTSDNTVTWTCQGEITLWKPSTSYVLGQPIYDPDSNGIYQATLGTSGLAKPNFNGSGPVVGGNNRHVNDNGISWIYIGQAAIWQPSSTYNSWWENSPCLACEPVLPSNDLLQAGLQNVYLQTSNDAPASGYVNSPGTSGTGYTPPWGTTAGFETADNQLQWVCLGSSVWAGNTAYLQWNGSTQLVFSVVEDTNGNFQVCIKTGSSGSVEPFAAWKASHAFSTSATIAVKFGTQYVQFTATTGGTTGTSQPTWDFTSGHTTSDGIVVWTAGGAVTAVWGTAYGQECNDGIVAWTCVGPVMTWATATQWYLPKSGFAPPTASQPYGGASVIGNNDVQFAISSGKSGSMQPSWGTVGTTISDGAGNLIWYNDSAFSENSLAWQFGHVYAYSFKARTPTDPYVTVAPPGVANPLGPYMGSGTGVITTASPAFTIVGANQGAVNTITGLGPTDPQFDTIVIWRDADGGGVANMFELTEIQAPAPINGVAQTWTFEDFLPDLATSTYPGLNNLIPAPINDSNDPPPVGFRPLCNKLHFARIWGAASGTLSNTVVFTGGPDVVTGNPNEAFDPTDTFPFDSTVIACIHTPTGLICPTTTDFECIYGGPSTDSFYDTTMLPGVGMLSYNAWDLFGGEIYFVSADSQGWTLNPATQLARIGFPIGNKIAALNAANVYLTVHESGTDNAIYLGDGSTGWYRLNPHQVNADISGENASVWSPKATIVGGCQMLQSLVTAPGVKKLLIGGTGTNEHIQKRDLTVFSDNGTAYSAWGDIGAITMVAPGQRAAVKFIEMDFMSVGTQPVVSRLLDDPTTSPSNWIALTNYVFDPPIVYAGTNITPNYWPDRFYFNQTADVAVGRRIRMKFDFGNTDTVRNELISFAIFGRKYVEQ